MPDDVDDNGGEVSDAMSENDNEYDDTDMIKEEDERMGEQNTSDNGTEATGGVKKKYDPKDPLRPRRKKARRACYACQRAHLTCGKQSLFSFATAIALEPYGECQACLFGTLNPRCYPPASFPLY
jgi:hypothetical protein